MMIPPLKNDCLDCIKKIANDYNSNHADCCKQHQQPWFYCLAQHNQGRQAQGGNCHHKAEILPCGVYRVKHLKLFGLYYHRPASELVFLAEADHKHIHSSGKNHYLFGKHQSEETRLKISEAKKGKHLSEAHRLSISISNKGREVSEKTRIKISNANKGKSHEYS